MIIVCGGNMPQSRAYCEDNGLTMNNARILADAEGLRGIRGGTLRLVGSFHQRPDSDRILTFARNRTVAVEDHT